MLARKTKKILKFFTVSLLTIIGVFMILFAFKDAISFFYTPSTLPRQISTEYRVGGIVKAGSIITKQIESLRETSFILTDQNAELHVYYTGSLPVLFAENQEVIAVGKLAYKEGYLAFEAQQILTKHNEYYRPKNLAPTS